MHKFQLAAEISLAGVAPTIASAIYDAAGVWMRGLPYTPERVKSVLNKLN